MAASAGPFVVAIDNGSQSTKVSVVDSVGRVHARAQRRLRPYASPAPGRWEHPDDDLWATIASATREALSAFDGDRTAIAGVGLCTIRFCRAVLRADGTLAQPVMSWMDERVARPFRAETPDARWVTTSSGYVTHRLTGQPRDTAGNAQGMWPIDTDTWQWSTDDARFSECGMTRDMLFDLVLPGEILGEVTDAAAAECGLPAGLPVVASSNDKAVEALGAGLRREGTTLVSLGTYTAAMMPDTTNRAASNGAWPNFAALPHEYLYESDGVRRGMWTVGWFRDLVTGLHDDAGLSATVSTQAEVLLNREASLVPAGSGGLVTVLDWLAPTDAPGRRGAFVGFDGTQGRGHMYRSILEAIAFAMHRNVGRVESVLGRSTEDLVVTGGGAASDEFMGILASVFGTPARRPLVIDAAGMGAAITAAVGTGVHDDWDAAIDTMVRFDAAVQPDRDLRAAYPQIEERHHRVVARVREALDGF